jgi:hypothetical protein
MFGLSLLNAFYHQTREVTDIGQVIPKGCMIPLVGSSRKWSGREADSDR